MKSSLFFFENTFPKVNFLLLILIFCSISFANYSCELVRTLFCEKFERYFDAKMLLVIWGWILFRVFFAPVDAGECVHSFAARVATCDRADFCKRPPLPGIRRVDLSSDPFLGVDVRCLTSAYPDVAVTSIHCTIVYISILCSGTIFLNF